MNTFLLFVLMCLIAYIMQRYSRYRFLSPSFISSAMFAVLALIYTLCLPVIRYEISLYSVLVVLLSELAIVFGEIIALRTEISGYGKKKREDISAIFQRCEDLNISNSVVIVFSVITLTLFLIRYMELSSLSGSGNFSSIVSLYKDYDTGAHVVNLSLLTTVGYYFSQVTAFLFSFLFVASLYKGKRNFILLLPVVVFALCAATTASRTEFFKIAGAFVLSYFICCFLAKDWKIKLKKILIIFAVFLLLFFWYGFAFRGIVFSGFDSIVSSVISYSCASLYGLDSFFSNPWDPDSTFGAHVFYNVYSLFGGADIDYFEKMQVVGNSGVRSNISTSLTPLIHDFGIGGLLFCRVLFAFLYIKVLDMLFEKRPGSFGFYFWYLLAVLNIFIVVFIGTGDKASGIYFNPKYLLELIISFLIVYSVYRVFQGPYSAFAPRGGKTEHNVLLAADLGRSSRRATSFLVPCMKEADSTGQGVAFNSKDSDP